MTTTARTRRVIGLLTAAALVAAGLGTAALEGAFSSGRSPAGSPAPPPSATAGGGGVGAWTAPAAGGALATDPTSELTSSQITFLRQVAARTWSFLSGPDLDPATHLLLDSVPLAGQPGPDAALQPPAAAREYTNPALIGTYLSAIVAARDLGLATPAQAEADAAAVLAQIERMPKYQGFLFRWYSTRNGAAIATPQGEQDPAGYVSTVDNGWLAQGLLVAQGAFPALSARFGALLGGMQWGFLYDRAADVLYNGYQVGGSYSKSTYQNAYSGPRIAEYTAIGSGKVPGALWWGMNRTPPAGHRQRQTPQGRTVVYNDPQNHRSYPVYEGHYVFDGIKFVPTFDGSLYQALAPDLVFPEQAMAPNSLGLNDRNTALAQGAYADGTGSPVWGWAPATSPSGAIKYTNYGVPDLASDQGTVSAAAVAPYAAFLALPVIPQQAYADISRLVADYPALYTRYGFLDSVQPDDGRIADRYMAVSQLTILMSIDDAVDHDRLQGYAAASGYGRALAPYFGLETFSIQGLGPSTGPTAAAGGTRTPRPKRSRPRRRRRTGS
ncbi:DUF3131 domain-containing protein [Streptacidiphilus sp. PB12-B1b]|uniref:glucoamylase family protein n=1 Tax=Streptacidiphilus sp. PB12-B1b TaxID=2705012 RepID=UPI0015FA651B|nr:glucoamylase family protein [Streptacidiphilus sp. PB12-B1b]QMU76608.1 DUF3131 domain-containing protein [Streptacidiphilus sp. PB12-B1b]